MKNPYQGVRGTPSSHRLNCDVLHHDVVQLQAVLGEHGGLQRILNNIVYESARLCHHHNWTILDRPKLLAAFEAAIGCLRQPQSGATGKRSVDPH